ncbi:hypothetical protein AV654_00610 [Paenibacillus elgii]|uniref:Beta-ketoacyl-[acyl-carrier-protein] synthase III C-terminal domain-containing protein n=1 Tax=Paenibacillus elgii TaxID=189691 RepID=A0A165RQC5_9BACL|nr:hypothetical protein [Paenibacillus elgii]KZE84441.1 hypothetical protein AV654_00610 [Paenibacillus elgii]
MSAHVLTGGTKLYISRLRCIVPEAESSLEAYCAEAGQPWEDSPPKWLFAHAGMSSPWPPVEPRLLDSTLPAVQIPVFGKHPVEYLCAEGKRRFGADRKFDLICYCHETVQHPLTTLPGLMLCAKFGHRHAQSFVLGQLGSLACIRAIDLCKRMLEYGEGTDGLFCMADRTNYPFSRMSWTGSIKGDAAVLCMVNAEAGDYEVVDYRIQPVFPEGSMRAWTSPDYERTMLALARQAEQALREMQAAGNAPDRLVIQNVSDAFVTAVAEAGKRCGIPVYVRQTWKAINFLGSDPFLTLQEAVSNGQLREEQSVLLLFASADYGIGLLTLRCSGGQPPS